MASERPLAFVLNEEGEPRHEPDIRKWCVWHAVSSFTDEEYERIEKEWQAYREREAGLAERTWMFDTGKRNLLRTRFSSSRDAPAVDVSTVFLGIDHGWTGDPVLWETMVFAGDECPLDREQRRYQSVYSAHLGHFEVVGQVREWMATEKKMKVT